MTSCGPPYACQRASASVWRARLKALVKRLLREAKLLTCEAARAVVDAGLREFLAGLLFECPECAPWAIPLVAHTIYETNAELAKLCTESAGVAHGAFKKGVISMSVRHTDEVQAELATMLEAAAAQRNEHIPVIQAKLAGRETDEGFRPAPVVKSTLWPNHPGFESAGHKPGY